MLKASFLHYEIVFFLDRFKTGQILLSMMSHEPAHEEGLDQRPDFMNIPDEI